MKINKPEICQTPTRSKLFNTLNVCVKEKPYSMKFIITTCINIQQSSLFRGIKSVFSPTKNIAVDYGKKRSVGACRPTDVKKKIKIVFHPFYINSSELLLFSIVCVQIKITQISKHICMYLYTIIVMYIHIYTVHNYVV